MKKRMRKKKKLMMRIKGFKVDNLIFFIVF